jgi:hypothetical protein
MFPPIWDVEVGVAIDHVAPDGAGALELVEPFINQLGRILVVWVEKARQHSGSGASPPIVVDDGPELDEQQTCFPREFADGLGLGKFRFD